MAQVNLVFSIFLLILPFCGLRRPARDRTVQTGRKLNGPLRTMAKSIPLTPQYVVSSQLSENEFADLAAQGFKSVINFRPDGEAASQISNDDAKLAAEASGLAFAHIPVRKFDLFADETVAEAERVFAALPGPVLAYCASGQRAAVVWAAVSARTRPVNDVLQALKTAGLDLEFLRDDLEAQADRARWSQGTADAVASTAAEDTQQLQEPAKPRRRTERAAA